MIRILFYDEGAQGTTQLGGGQLERLELAARLDEDTFHPTLLTSFEGELAAAWRARKLDVVIKNIVGELTKKSRSAVLQNPSALVRYALALRRAKPLLFAAIAETEADIVHPNENFSRTVTALAKKKLSIPATMHIDNIFGNALADRMLVRLYAKAFDHLIAVSHFVAEPFKRFADDEKISVVYQGIDSTLYNSVDQNIARARLGLPRGRFVLVIVGKLTKIKGHRHLFDAVAALDEEKNDVTILVVGSGPEEKALRQYTVRRGIGPRVTFLGQRSDIPEILAAADVLAVPSLTEALPRVLYEGMAAGKAIIASAVGGIPELLNDGRNGLLVPPASAAGLSRAIRVLMADTKLRSSLGNTAQETVRRFSLTKAAKTTEEIYLKIANPI